MATISVSLPADGTTADVADYNTPINTIVNEINGNLDNNNIVAGAAISTSKLADDAGISTAKITDSAVTAAKLAVGVPVQMTSVAYTSASTGTTQIPFDNTIPQNTEGTEFMTLAITPKSTTNILVIDVVCWLSSDTASRNLIAALFQDSTANALAAGAEFTDDSATLIPRLVRCTHRMVAGTTSSTTFKVRGGANNTGTTTFNGVSGASIFGAITKSSIVITEYKAS